MLKKFVKKLSVVAIIFCLFVSYIPKVQAYTIDPIDGKIECTATVDDEFADDRVLIVLNEESSYSLKDYTAADFSELGCTKVEDLTYNATKAVRDELAAKANGNILKPEDENPFVNTENYKRVLSLDLNKKSKENVLHTANRLLARNDVYYAGPDYVLTAQSTIPDDPFYPSEWAMPDIGLPQCWDFTTGSPEVIVGVLDTGIDSSHADLSGAIAYNLCRDFTTGSEAVVSSPVDPQGHGTHVAGIIGATGNNKKCVCGVCWNVKLASLRVFTTDGHGYSSYVAQAIQFAQTSNIRLLNLSGGWKNII